MFRVAQLFYFPVDSGMSLAFQAVKPLDDAIEGLGLIFAALPQAALFRAGRTSVKYRRDGGAKANVLADFFISAHAAVLGCCITSHYRRCYRKHFPPASPSFRGRLQSPR